MVEGIRCRSCGCGHCPVVNTYKRQINWNGKVRVIIRRRRVCRNCKLPFFTNEDVEEDDVDLTESKVVPVEPPEIKDEEPPERNPYL